MYFIIGKFEGSRMDGFPSCIGIKIMRFLSYEFARIGFCGERKSISWWFLDSVEVFLCLAEEEGKGGREKGRGGYRSRYESLIIAFVARPHFAQDGTKWKPRVVASSLFGFDTLLASKGSNFNFAIHSSFIGYLLVESAKIWNPPFAKRKTSWFTLQLPVWRWDCVQHRCGKLVLRLSSKIR